LRALATAIDAFDGDQFSAGGHFLGRPGNQKRSNVSLTVETLRCNAAHARIRIGR
jgi:hypothetical protein